MYNKDFNILGLKIDSLNNKKDISFVTDINSYVQKIENICRTQKNEIPSQINLGVNYYDFIFNPISGRGVLEQSLEAALNLGIKSLKKTKVKVVSYTDTNIYLDVTFSVRYNNTENSTTCRIEVELV
jgi:hypothetical protein